MNFFRDKFDRFMLKFSRLSSNNRSILINIAGSFGVRGIALIVSLFTMPVYTHFFINQQSLGIWYTLLAVLNWVLTFDLGLGNGLRNKLPIAIAEKNRKAEKEYISSTYFGTIGVIILVGIVGIFVIPRVSWVSVINVHTNSISNDVLVECVFVLFGGILLQFILKIVTSILFAIQRSALVNALSLVTSVLTLVMILFARSGSPESNLLNMAIINTIAANLPYLIATIFVFSGPLKGFFPRWRNVTSKRVKEVLNIGVTLLVLQLVFMIISNTNELLISHLTRPSDVVIYQAYNKIFNTVSSLFTLALTPIWSAVTKAAGEKQYAWIRVLNSRLLLSSGIVLMSEMLLVPFLQEIVNLWLGAGYIKVVPFVSILFVFFNVLSFVHNVNTSFGNGMSFFKVQIIWMIFAAVVDIPLAVLFVNVFDGWIGVVVANFVALLPFELIEIFSFRRYISELAGK